jgi:hypothetical protein
MFGRVQIINFLNYKVMKATIDFLWSTGRRIISFDGSEFSRPTTFAELKKCSNVIVGEKLDDDPRCKERSVMIDDNIYVVCPSSARHTGGPIRFLEIM